MKRTIAIAAVAVAVTACSEAPAEASTEANTAPTYSEIVYLKCEGLSNSPLGTLNIVDYYKIDFSKKRLSRFIAEREVIIDIDAEIHDYRVTVIEEVTAPNVASVTQYDFDRYEGTLWVEYERDNRRTVTTSVCNRVDGPPVRQF